jgi:hypothetical protein
LNSAESISSTQAAKLPLWRLTLALLALAAMIGVLLSLAPVYYENYQLDRYMKELVRGAKASTLTDEALRAGVRTRARELDLPIRAEDLNIAHADGKTQLHAKYKVDMNFPLYEVEVHLQASAASR